MKREKAYVDSRRQRVFDLLNKNPEIKADELAELLQVSVVTIRRDMRVLEEEKKIRRFYGGAAVTEKKRIK